MLLMSTSEIIRSYRTAANPQKQIGVLADLNLVSKAEIKQVLIAAGVILKKEKPKPRKFNKEAAMQYYKMGLSDEDIGKRMGNATNTVSKWRQQEGLRPNKRKEG